MQKIRRFYATAPRGIAPLLADEIRELGAVRVQAGAAGVSFDGDLECAYRVCLWSRLANRILLPVTKFQARDADELYHEVNAIHWERHLESSGTLAVDCTLVDSPIGHSRYAALKTKDAIVDRFREKFGERPSVDLETPDLRINLHLRGSDARINIDLSGGSLHRRGYRLAGAAAPLKENLAAAILIEAGWPAIAERGGALLDPMCGSGTLLVEGALMAADIAPGLLREHFGLLYWKQHELDLWARLWREAEERREVGLAKLPPIYGFDRDADALDAAEANIERAGLLDHIELRQQWLEEAPGVPTEKGGLLVSNPPYGERLGELDELRPLYTRLGKLLRFDLGGWDAAIFTANPELATHIGIRSEKPVEFFNGPLACRLFLYPSQAGTSTAEGEESSLVRPELADSEGARMFANRLRKNLKHLGKWARREGIDCYRIYDADLPEYALAVDLYHDEEGKRWVHVQEYQAPKTVAEEKAMQRLQEALAAIPGVLEIPEEQLFYKVRRRQKGKAQYQRSEARGRFHSVREGRARLLVNFSDYLDTGLFLDHRPTRLMIGERSEGKRVLNLFCYTGAASVHAILGGAERSTSVDLSNTYLEWARRNFELNDIDDRRHELFRADCLSWVQRKAHEGQRQYELIFIDPPTFSNSKGSSQTFDVQRDHVELLSNALRLLANGGELIFSNNFRRFQLDEEALKQAHPGLMIEEISRQTLPKDFERNPKIHRCWRLTLQ